MDRPASGIAGVDAARLRSRPIGRHETDRMAARARPRSAWFNITSRSPARSSPRTGSAGRTLYDAVQASGHELLLEVIVPKSGPAIEDDTVYRSLKRLYNLGIYPEWWKLEPMSAQQWQAIDALIAERDPACRGVVLLGLSAAVEQLSDGFKAAAASVTCRGFTGRGARFSTSRAMRGSRVPSTTRNSSPGCARPSRP